MDRLSRSLSELKPEYDVVVVGSGYGGAVTACRLAGLRKSDGSALSVAVLERGAELLPGDFPRSARAAVRQIQVDAPRGRFGSRQGLYDFHVNADVSALVGCGLGGGSLINAGVLLRPTPEVLADGAWPAAFRASGGELDGCFDRSFAMLGATSFPDTWPQPRKLLALRDAAASGRSRARRAPIAVSFQTRVNAAGVQQQACTLCGECVTGCNYSAKNTLPMNYLAAAAREGVEIFCGMRVESLRPAGEGRGWVLRLDLADPGWRAFRPPFLEIRAGVVVLSAGTLGSTEILLRSADRWGMELSPRLGERFSANGDVLAFAYNTERTIDGVGIGEGALETPLPGPTITGYIDERFQEQPCVVEEGIIPGPLGPLVRALLPLAARYGGRTLRRELPRRMAALARELESTIRGARRGAIASTQVYLVMSRDAADGRMHLAPDGRLRVAWPEAGRDELWARIDELLEPLARKLGGTHVANPLWGGAFGRRLLTVHPLGGCGMAEEGSRGVVDHEGAVFQGRGPDAYGDLYVADGSIIPCALGVNPLWTISALAERNAARMIARHGWLARDTGVALPELVAAGGAQRPAAAPRTPRAPRAGLRFTERMVGSFREEATANEAPLWLTLIVETDDVAALAAPPRAHDRDGDTGPGRARITGVAECDLLARGVLTVSEGTFLLFVPDPTRVETCWMIYDMVLSTPEGERFRLSGRKTIRRQPLRREAWGEFFRLDYTLTEGAGEGAGAGRVRGRGTLELGFRDFLRSVARAQVTDAPQLGERLEGMHALVAAYARNMGHLAWPLQPRRLPDRQRMGTRRAQGAGEEHPVLTDDGVQILLTRWRKQEGAPPVILAPGWGTSTYAFTLPTLEENFADHLARRGFDVWLLDWRGSDLSPGSGTQYSLDEVASYDWPRALREVFQVTGRKAHCIGHCLGSMSLLMGLLRGTVSEHIASAICSQSFLMLDMPLANQLKAHLRLARMIYLTGGLGQLTSSFEAGLARRAIDRLLHLYPSRERCSNPVCRRILFLFGDVYRHEALDAATHDEIHRMFSRADLTTYLQVSDMIRRGRVLDQHGGDTYLTLENARRIRVPVTLVQGKLNNLFRPRGARRTHEWLRSHMEPGIPLELLELEGYGHMDTFIGRSAARDVYPKLVRRLRLHAGWPARAAGREARQRELPPSNAPLTLSLAGGGA